MLIAGLKQYKAIPKFQPVELPPLTVLTGLNGSGKSQLLAGIQLQEIACDLVRPLTAQPLPMGMAHGNPVITLLQHSVSSDSQFNLQRPSKLAERFTPSAGMAGRMGIATYQFNEFRSKQLEGPRAKLDQTFDRKLEKMLGHGEDPWRLGAVELTRRAAYEADDDRADLVRRAFRLAASALESNGPIDPIHAMFFSHIATAATEFSVTRLDVTKEMVDALTTRTSVQMFQPNIVELFGAYRDRLVGNDMDELQARRDPTKKFLNPEQFVGTYGTPPWEAVSDLLAAMALPFEVVPPAHDMTDNVRFRLRSTEGGNELGFDDLSSGEQVLLRFALSVMRPNPNMVGLQRPLLLLLDEMDASLHPEMVQRWLGAIERGIVGELGIHVILTTHSPTTVALAPENSVFAMLDSRPKKVSKQEAINKLTFGVPTLSIDYSGRRQVFCESDTDAAAYEKIYAAIKQRLSLSKEINFIGTGIRDKTKVVDVGLGQEINAGEAVVREIVRKLSDLSVTSIFGLIDWDAKAVATDRVFVIGAGTYYTVENILLDPLLIGSLMVLERMEIPGMQTSARGLDTLDDATLQKIADRIQNSVELPGDDGSMIEVCYLGGRRIRVKKCYATVNGHELENQLAKVFGPLRRYTANRGTLNRRIAEIVINDYPEFCPKIISDTFERISKF